MRVGSAPLGVAFDSESGDVFVANSGMDTVSVIDPTTGQVTAGITVGSEAGPLGLRLGGQFHLRLGLRSFNGLSHHVPDVDIYRRVRRVGPRDGHELVGDLERVDGELHERGYHVRRGERNVCLHAGNGTRMDDLELCWVGRRRPGR